MLNQRVDLEEEAGNAKSYVTVAQVMLEKNAVAIDHFAKTIEEYAAEARRVAANYREGVKNPEAGTAMLANYGVIAAGDQMVGIIGNAVSNMAVAARRFDVSDVITALDILVQAKALGMTVTDEAAQ